MSFKRSPSKVWWGSDVAENRETSKSPGSQDSGFSDAEGSPHNSGQPRKTRANEENNNNNVDQLTPQRTTNRDLAETIFKDACHPDLNLTSNYREKSTPVKENIDRRLVKSDRKTSSSSAPPQVALRKFAVENAPFTEPPRKQQKYIKHSPKVSRNLFAACDRNTEECPSTTTIAIPNQYSKLTSIPTTTTTQANQQLEEEEEEEEEKEEEQETTPEEIRNDYDTSSVISGTKSLPVLIVDDDRHLTLVKSDRSAPAAVLRDTTAVSSSYDGREESTAFNNSTSSECESELECIFEELEHTSTPNGEGRMRSRRNRGGRLQDRLRQQRYHRHQHERVPPIHTDGVTVDNQAVLRWLQEARTCIEQECTTTLQCKSIAAELGQKVSQLAACATTILRGLLSHSRCIEMDYKNLNRCGAVQVSPLVQSLAGNILDFLKTHHSSQVNSKVLKLYDRVKSATVKDTVPPSMDELYAEWETVQKRILVREVKRLVDRLEDPTSEMDLRATLTGITSVALRNPDLIDHFIKADVVPILLILCEKCEGSSMKTLLLRALSTMCSNSAAIRHFEKFSGIQIIADTLEETSKPEPERSEAVALLAQVTAPWMEDNHSIKGLQDYSKKLVESLTKFAASTKCCQNLLLCAAALANLSSMDTKSIKYLVRRNTGPILLAAVRARGPMVSVYLLEQVATLLANMAAVEGARMQLAGAEAPLALLYFLRPSRLPQNEDVERRLQQKSVIALSRLCGNAEAATQIVDNGGVERLVQLCREKKERFNSDAVLVAALATLRKIAESCGRSVINVQDCQELVEPKLLDSFLAYSTQSESYV